MSWDSKEKGQEEYKTRGYLEVSDISQTHATNPSSTIFTNSIFPERIHERNIQHQTSSLDGYLEGSDTSQTQVTNPSSTIFTNSIFPERIHERNIQHQTSSLDEAQGISSLQQMSRYTDRMSTNWNSLVAQLPTGYEAPYYPTVSHLPVTARTHPVPVNIPTEIEPIDDTVAMYLQLMFPSNHTGYSNTNYSSLPGIQSLNEDLTIPTNATSASLLPNYTSSVQEYSTNINVELSKCIVGNTAYLNCSEDTVTQTYNEKFNHETASATDRDGRKSCIVEGCKSQARAFGRCKRHGGSKRCCHPGCTKSVQSRGLCIRHGGGSRCQDPGCTRAAQSQGHCKSHGGGRPCMVEGCEKKAHLKRLCRRHGGGSKCIVFDCDKWAQQQGMCMTHSKQQLQEKIHDTSNVN